MQIPHELPLITMLLPQRPAFTQQSIKAEVTTNSRKRQELSVDCTRLLHFMTSLDSNTSPKLMFVAACSSSAGRP